MIERSILFLRTLEMKRRNVEGGFETQLSHFLKIKGGIFGGLLPGHPRSQ
jgi:hypothetical protein